MTSTGCAVDLGWGRVVFGQTFEDLADLRSLLRDEASGRRDICIYLPDPQVFVGLAPDEFFVDPSLTFRLGLRHEPAIGGDGINVVDLRGRADAEQVNRIYAANRMVAADVDTLVANRYAPHVIHLVAVDRDGGRPVGTVTGIDHRVAFGDAEAGSSLWSLAVAPECSRPGVGGALIAALARRCRGRGLRHLDLSVVHDNANAIELYERLGFRRIPVLCVKRKNPINLPLFTTASDDVAQLGIYARVVAEEAQRRGIQVEVLDVERGYLRLSHAGRSIVTRESMSELTSAVALDRAADKLLSRRIVSEAGITVPAGRLSGDEWEDLEFLARHAEIVVKPRRGEQGAGVSVGVVDADGLRAARDRAALVDRDVLLEARHAGQDVRIVVIGDELVAAAVRRPPAITGTGRHSVLDLLEQLNRRRSAATEGESSVPIDAHTVETIRASGYRLDSVPVDGAVIVVRRTANLHTGGTIHDVTDEVHPALVETAVDAAHALDLPVAGIDLIAPDPRAPAHVFIEANERPGLANHAPQPTVERFVDLLFPSTRPADPASPAAMRSASSAG